MFKDISFLVQVLFTCINRRKENSTRITHIKNCIFESIIDCGYIFFEWNHFLITNNSSNGKLSSKAVQFDYKKSLKQFLYLVSSSWIHFLASKIWFLFLRFLFFLFVVRKKRKNIEEEKQKENICFTFNIMTGADLDLRHVTCGVKGVP